MPDLALQPLPDPPYDELVDHLVRRRHLGEHRDVDLARAAAETNVARIRERTRVLDVLEPAGAVRGRVWLLAQGEDQAVLRLALDDPAHAAGVRLLLEDLGRELRAARLTVGVYPGDLVTEAFVDGAGYETAAVQMRLDLEQALPGEDVVVLEPMDQAAYTLWEADEIESYAEARALSGESPDQALKISHEQHAELLPDGLATEHHHFFAGRVSGEQVGTLWIGTQRPMAFVYDVAVDEAHRRRGYGGGLMRAGALWTQQHGSHALGLNVFGYNHAARALYAGLGYEVVEMFAAKAL